MKKAFVLNLEKDKEEIEKIQKAVDLISELLNLNRIELVHGMSAMMTLMYNMMTEMEGGYEAFISICKDMMDIALDEINAKKNGQTT